MEIYVILVLDVLIFNSLSNFLYVLIVYSYNILMGKNFWGVFLFMMLIMIKIICILMICIFKLYVMLVICMYGLDFCGEF